MLKWLAILVVILAGAHKPLPVHWDNQHQEAQQQSAEAHPDAQATGTSDVEKENAANAERYAYYKAHPKEYFRDALAPANLSNWVLAGLGVIGGFLAGLTVLGIKRQIDHVAASERAWLTVDVLLSQAPEPESKLVWIDVPITNRGKTPARMHSIKAMPKFIPVPNAIADNKPGKLPPDPDYSDAEKLTELRGYDVIVAPGDTFMHHVYIWPGEYKEVITRMSTLYVYATIEYFDTIGGDRHTTSFCSIYAVPLPYFNEPTGFTFSPYIPATYFRAT